MTRNEFVEALAARYLTTLAARDALCGYHAKTAWPNAVITDAAYDKQKVRVRAFYRSNVEVQANFAPAGSRRFTTTGLFYFEINAPANSDQSNKLLGDFAEVVAAAFRGVAEPNGVWYRDVTIQDQAPSAEWFRTRVGGKYSFDRIG